MDELRDYGVSVDAAQTAYDTSLALGECYLSVGDYVRARMCYEKAALLSPDEPGPYVGLGVIALQRNQWDDADTAFRVACRLDPACSRAYAGLGTVAQTQEDFARAFDLYLKCLELDTDNLSALLGLFQASCQMGSFAKVIHYLQVYLRLHPKDISVMFTLAAIYMKECRFEQSRKILQDILLLDAGNKDATDLLEEVNRSLTRQRKGG